MRPRIPRPLLALLAALATGASCPPKPDPRLNQGDIYELVGEVQGVAPGTPLLVAAYSNFPGRRRVEGVSLCHPLQGEQGAYGIVLPPGDYERLAFADLDHDGVFRDDELVGRALELTVGLTSAPDGFTVQAPPFRVDLGAPGKAGLGFQRAVTPQSFASLTDPFFDPRWGLPGLLRPTTLLDHTSNAMLFGFGPLDPTKVQLLFVHGVKGTPRDFLTFAQWLDHTRYQAWFAFYPTGLPLEKMGAKVADLVRMLATRSQVVLVAHSMGGLVCRSALNHLQYPSVRAIPENLKGYVSFSAMYGGMPNATNLYLLAPYDDEIPRSLLDVPPQSDFMRDLYAVPYPSGLKFHLFWGNVTGDGDGTIPKESQLYWPMASQAVQLHEYGTDHTGILGPVVQVDFRATLGSLAVPGGPAPEPPPTP